MGIKKLEKREDVVLIVRTKKDKKYIRKSEEYAHVSLFDYKGQVCNSGLHRNTIFFNKKNKN